MTNDREAQQAGLKRADTRQKVLQAVSRLPGRQRRLLLLRELEGSSYAEIGEIMGISPIRVGKMLYRARLGFRQAYASQIGDKEKKEKCRRLGHLLSVFNDGELLGPARRKALEHLAECTGCRRMKDKLASTSELLATLVPTPAPPGKPGSAAGCASPKSPPPPSAPLASSKPPPPAATAGSPST